MIEETSGGVGKPVLFLDFDDVVFFGKTGAHMGWDLYNLIHHQERSVLSTLLSFAAHLFLVVSFFLYCVCVRACVWSCVRGVETGGLCERG